MEYVNAIAATAKYALGQSISLDVGRYVATSGVVSLIAAILLSVLVGGAARKEMKYSGIFRSEKDAIFLYPITLAPFVQAWLLAFLRFGVVSPSSVDWTIAHGISFAFVVWLTNAFHGIFLDLTTFKMTPAVAINWWLGSLTMALVNGAMLGYFF